MRLLHLSVLFTSTAAALVTRKPNSHNVVRRELAAYEERYIRTQNYQYHNQTVKLVGYQTIKIPVEQRESFDEHYSVHGETLQEIFPSHFYDSYAAELRIYFPVKSALLDHDGSMVEANHLGEFEYDALNGNYAILGRRQTPEVHGTASNIIRDGTIFLTRQNHPIRQIGNTRIYDFGRRSLDDHHHAHGHGPTRVKRFDSPPPPSATPGTGGESNSNNWDNGLNPEAPNNGCAANHGGINCSKAYGINYDASTGAYSGSCPANFDGVTCMDFNGPGTDCNRANRLKYFLGSDCAEAVAMGNCWNEMYGAAKGIGSSLWNKVTSW